MPHNQKAILKSSRGDDTTWDFINVVLDLSKWYAQGKNKTKS